MNPFEIGILALQGDFEAHAQIVRALGRTPRFIRSLSDFEQPLAGLILPGGESSVQLKLLHGFGLSERLDDFVRSGRPVFGTCAGAILMAKRVLNPTQFSFGWIPMTVTRNAFGDQRHSSEVELSSTVGTHRAVFIRAPRIESLDPAVECLARHENHATLVRYENRWAATFHPEIVGDLSIHAAVFR